MACPAGSPTSAVCTPFLVTVHSRSHASRFMYPHTGTLPRDLGGPPVRTPPMLSSACTTISTDVAFLMHCSSIQNLNRAPPGGEDEALGPARGGCPFSREVWAVGAAHG
jgi:hypothetical protein